MLIEASPGAADDLQALYRQTIVRHAARPVGYQPEFVATHRCERYNPLCGDRIEVLLRLRGDEILDAGFFGEACAICMASASLMCEQHKGMTVAQLQQALDWLHNGFSGETVGNGQDPLAVLLAVRQFPSRIKCATLPWDAALGAAGFPG